MADVAKQEALCSECGHTEHRYGPIGVWAFGRGEPVVLSEPQYLPLPCPVDGCDCGEVPEGTAYA